MLPVHILVAYLISDLANLVCWGLLALTNCCRHRYVCLMVLAESEFGYWEFGLAWITEMASYLKSIDREHLLEVGLEGFYGESAPTNKQFNLNFQLGTDFIENNQIPSIDFATLHSYPDQWFPGTNEESQLAFSNNWMNTHIQDAQTILRKPLLVTEFGWNNSMFDTNTSDLLLNSVYSNIYSSARHGGVAAGGMFWQLLPEGLDSLCDGYEIILSASPSTAGMIAYQSQKLTELW